MSSPFPTNSFQLPFGVKTLSPYPVDYWSGPFTGDSYSEAVSSANQQIPSSIRFISMGVRLVVDDVPKMYWYSGGTADNNLVEFIGEVGSGYQGFQGFQGNIGVTGVQGFQGFQGNIGITGTQGFQGFQGPVGITGTQGFQGFQGLVGITGTQGFQGFQGNIGITGVQGFQGFQGSIGITGAQGFQGFQGLKGSGKYFYGPTAPESTDDGLTLGSKWFNTTVGAEFTYIVEGDDTTQWVMVNVFSATGPQGPAGSGSGEGSGSQGFQGFQGNIGTTGTQGFQGFQGNIGITGVQGFQGFQGLRGSTGDGLFDTTYDAGTNQTNTINYSTIGNVTGTARKFPVLLNDGSLTFDFIRTTDLFNNFKISSFTISGSSSVLIGTGSYSMNGRTFTAAYLPTGVNVTAASISVDTTSTGYPVSLTPPYTTLSAPGSINYPLDKNESVTFTITATADGDTAISTASISFRQYNYWGVTSGASITVGDISTALTGKALSASRVRTFTVNAAAGEYIYYSYPESYGDATFRVDGTIGGFTKTTIAGGETHTNSNGYDEKYRIYRSDSSGLGNTTVEVT